MSLIFWLFLIYSFLGYLLEKAFAMVTGAEQTVRKCFLLLPLCPVYGIGVLAVLVLPSALTDSFPELALWGGLAATAVEYVVHCWYDVVFHVRFWDYTEVRGNLKGRVCLPFSVALGLLLALFLPWLHPWLFSLADRIPPWMTFAAWLLFVADTVLSARVLQLYQDTELLSAANLLQRK